MDLRQIHTEDVFRLSLGVWSQGQRSTVKAIRDKNGIFGPWAPRWLNHCSVPHGQCDNTYCYLLQPPSVIAQRPVQQFAQSR